MTRPFQKVVAAIIIDKQDNILITQRLLQSHLGGYWEFPGGQVEKNETEEQALVRELREETGLEICIGHKFWEENFDYDIKTVQLSFYFCRLCYSNQSVQLKEIKDFRWIKNNEFSKYQFPPADAALIKQLQKFRYNT